MVATDSLLRQIVYRYRIVAVDSGRYQ